MRKIMRHRHWRQHVGILLMVSSHTLAQATSPQENTPPAPKTAPSTTMAFDGASPIPKPPVIAAGFAHTVAIRFDGKVLTWGTDEALPSDIQDAIDIAAGVDHTLALRRDGTVVAWGENASSQTSVPKDLKDVIQVSAARYYSVALRK